MKVRAKVYRLASLIIALLVAVFTVGYAFAWLANRKDSDITINGTSDGAFFDGGDGSKENPFIITNYNHMHNLAVLQNTGRLVDESGNPKKYYFEINKNVDAVDMSGKYIPPIGNDENPFIGDFNGNGKTITNVVVTTNKSDLAADYPLHASADYEFSRAVGLFGMTANVSESDKSNVHNVILNNPEVRVANVNTLYSTSANKAVGLAVGHVAGKCQSIGVRAIESNKTILDVDVTGYSTFNSILGELANGVQSSVTGGGAGSEGTGGSGNAFGASFDVESLSKRLFDIYLGKYGKTYKSGANERPLDNLLPLIDTQSDNPVPALGYKVPFTVDSAKSIYTGATAQEIAANNNVGYVMGNQNKISTKTLKFASDEPSINSMIRGNDGTYTMPDGSAPTNNSVPRWFYVQNDGWENSNYQERVGFGPISQEKYNELPDNLKSLLVTESKNQRTYAVMRIQAQFNEYGTVPINSNALDALTWGYHGQISWMGKTYGEGIADNDGNAVNSIGYNFTSDGYLLDDKDYMFELKNGQKFYVVQDENWNGEAHSVEYGEGNAVALTDDGIYFGRYRASSDDAYIYGYLDENGYFYNENGFVVAEAIDGVVASVTAEGYAIAPDGKYYGKYTDWSTGSGVTYLCDLNEDGYVLDDDGYLVLSFSGVNVKSDKTDSEGRVVNENGELYAYYQYGWPNGVVTVDSDGYLRDDNRNYMVQNYPAVITYIDGDGYAVDANGNYYDKSGGLADADGYLINSDGTYYANVSNHYPLNQCSVDEEGYFILYNGERYVDGNGNTLRAYGYYKAQDGNGNYYLADEEGNAVTFKDEWGNVNTLTLKQASGEKVEVASYANTNGGVYLTAKKGDHITAEKGENIYVKSGSAVPLYAYKSGVALPNNGIWFKPSQAGKMRFVMFAQKDSESFSLLKCTRTNATVANPFYTTGDDDITVQKVIQQRLPVYALFYYEFEVKAEEVYNTEYVIVIDNNVQGNGAYFLYLDIGSSADEEVTDTSTVVTDAISAVDFIYDGVEIEQTDTTIGVGNFIVNVSGEKALYEASKTSVYFVNITQILKIVYVRLNNDTSDNKHLNKTICLEGSDPALNTDSEVVATFATYVCPTISGGSGTVGGGGGGTDTPTPTPTVSSVSVTPTTASIEVGGTTTLNASVTMSSGSYSGSITWSSSDTSVATVVNGVVTGVKAGTAKITASAGGVTSNEVTITVNASSQPGTTITVNLDMTQDQNASSHPLNLTTDNGYYTITSSGGNFNYSTNTGLGNCLLTGGGKRSIIVTAGEIVESLTITVKFAVGSNSSMSSVGTATITNPDGTSENKTSVLENGTVAIIEYPVTLTAGQSLTIYSENRLALIGATAQVTPKT